MRLLLFTLLITSSLSAQHLISGKVIAAESNLPLPGVTIQNTKGGEWSVSQKNGHFKIQVANDDFELQFKMLGKQTAYLQDEELSKTDSLIISLANDNLRLDNVTVTAIPKRAKIGSAIVLDNYAVDQVQAFDIGDILEQLPGMDINYENPSEPFNSAQSISLRTASPSATNAFGVSYMLDGLQISNDENMQNYNYRDGLTQYDNTNSGIDLRSIPASNIEEIEVISGIPDARYGNLTSGLIKINRKAGITPLRVNANLQQGNTSVSVGKGFSIGKELGKLSLSFDYLNANSDPRKSLQQYDRITASAIWTTYSKDQDLRNTLSLTLHNNLDDTKYDKDMDDGGKDAKFKKDRGIRISNRLNWKPGTSLIDHLSFSTGFSYTYQHSYAQSFKNDGGRVVPQSLETGLFAGAYTPVAYLQVRQVYGQPLNLNSQLRAERTISSQRWKHQLSFGIDANYSHNSGRGRTYDPENAHTQVTLSSAGSSLSSGEGIRPLDFGRYVKPRISTGVFAQDNITFKFNNGNELYTNIGFRYDVQNGFQNYSPRVNLGYELSDQFSIRGALGFASKAPSLNQVFPGDKYFDILIRDFRTSNYSFNLVQTYKKEIPRQEIEPSKSWKYELGANYNPDFGNFALTAFYNTSFDGVTTYNHMEAVAFPEINFIFSDPELPPSYQVNGYSSLLLDYSLNANALKTIDKGIEFYMNFNKIDAINTSFNINGTYTRSSSNSSLDVVVKNTNPLNTAQLYGIYNRQASRSDLIRLRGTLTHHISEIGLLISLTAEQFTRQVEYPSATSIYPTGYINPEGERLGIPEADRTNTTYSDLWLNPSTAEKKVTPTYHNFNLRITKELLNGLSLSFYASNFLNYRPVVKVNETRTLKNSPISFGGQIKYQF